MALIHFYRCQLIMENPQFMNYVSMYDLWLLLSFQTLIIRSSIQYSDRRHQYMYKGVDEVPRIIPKEIANEKKNNVMSFMVKYYNIML